MRTGLGVHTLASPNFAGQKRSTKFMGVDIYRFGLRIHVLLHVFGLALVFACNHEIQSQDKDEIDQLYQNRYAQGLFKGCLGSRMRESPTSYDHV
ncbi:uncharacterized protein DFL_001341 [Arthrobotrys flagrans]|uniref:Uncharacterized protein n=1 Tax=Arthrobotrys flagrans TaxID=97331 RepID=A0A437AGU0_ARTFL|nr:hypothetical protein DFL_001341 [Arthrobotrys flagrans]